MKHILKQNKAMTMLEVVLAVVIFTVTTTIVMQFLTTGDRLFGRNVLVENATRLANNEAEFLKAGEVSLENIEDAEYEIEVAKRLYQVNRIIMSKDSLDSLVNHFPIRQVNIYVKDLSKQDDTLVVFKYIQGFNY